MRERGKPLKNKKLFQGFSKRIKSTKLFPAPVLPGTPRWSWTANIFLPLAKGEVQEGVSYRVTGHRPHPRKIAPQSRGKPAPSPCKGEGKGCAPQDRGWKAGFRLIYSSIPSIFLHLTKGEVQEGVINRKTKKKPINKSNTKELALINRRPGIWLDKQIFCL